MSGFLGNMFDMNGDGKLDADEQFMDFMFFNDLMNRDEDDSEEEEDEEW